MKEKLKSELMAEINHRIESDEYNTNPEKKRVLWDKIFLGSRVYFYWRYFMITFRMYRLAVKDDYSDDEFMLYSNLTINLLEDIGGKIKIEGIDNLKSIKDAPVVFVANHMSTMETLLLPAIIVPVRKICTVVKESLKKIPVYGRVIKSTRVITVGRVNPREDMKIVFSEGQRLISEGISVFIFQQGTRDPVFDPEKFSSLGIKLAQKSGVKIVPVALKTDFWGNGSLIRDLGPINRKENIHVAFGKPMTFDEYGKNTNEKIIEFIEEKLKQWDHKPKLNSL